MSLNVSSSIFSVSRVPCGKARSAGKGGVLFKECNAVHKPHRRRPAGMLNQPRYCVAALANRSTMGGGQCLVSTLIVHSECR